MWKASNVCGRFVHFQHCAILRLTIHIVFSVIFKELDVWDRPGWIAPHQHIMCSNNSIINIYQLLFYILFSHYLSCNFWHNTLVLHQYWYHLRTTEHRCNYTHYLLFAVRLTNNISRRLQLPCSISISHIVLETYIWWNTWILCL